MMSPADEDIIKEGTFENGPTVNTLEGNGPTVDTFGNGPHCEHF